MEIKKIAGLASGVLLFCCIIGLPTILGVFHPTKAYAVCNESFCGPDGDIPQCPCLFDTGEVNFAVINCPGCDLTATANVTPTQTPNVTNTPVPPPTAPQSTPSGTATEAPTAVGTPDATVCDYCESQYDLQVASLDNILLLCKIIAYKNQSICIDDCPPEDCFRSPTCEAQFVIDTNECLVEDTGQRNEVFDTLQYCLNVGGCLN